MLAQYQVRVLRDVENKVLNRRELIIRIDHVRSKTPTRDQVRELVSSMLSIPASLVIVRELRSLTGTNVSEAHVHVYKDMSSLEEIEPEHIKRRNFGEGEAKREEKGERAS